MTTLQRITLTVGAGDDGARIDKFMATRAGEVVTRSLAVKLIRDGLVLVDGQPAARASLLLKAGQTLAFDPPAPKPERLVPEDIPLEVLYEDEFVVAINKPPGMVTHPASTAKSGTLANAIAHRFATLSNLHADPTRVGIIHRLDRDTSGVILVARDERVHFRLGRQFERRVVRKRYIAVVHGCPEWDEFSVDAPIGRHDKHREMMCVRRDGRAAQTSFRVRERYGRYAYALLDCHPLTGRTHQIRVHLAYRGFPVIGDRVYGANRQPPRYSMLDARPPAGVDTDSRVIARQALHAASITFHHPVLGREITIEAPLPADMQHLLDVFRANLPVEHDDD